MPIACTYRAALLLRALAGDVAVLATVVAATAAAEATAKAAAATTTTTRGAVTRDVADTTAGVARLAAVAAGTTTVATGTAEATTETTGSGVTGLRAETGLNRISKETPILSTTQTHDVTGLAATVALAASGAAETAGGGTLRAGRREVALLAAGVAGLGLRLGALAREVTSL